MTTRAPLVLLTALLFCNIACGYNILGIFTMFSKSHYITGGALMKGLAAAGHNVTVISPFPQSKPLPNYRDISILGAEKAVYENVIKNASSTNDLSVVQSMLIYMKIGLFYTNFTLKHPVMQEFLGRTDEHFDLIVCEITLNEAMLGLGQHFNAPVVAYSAAGARMWTTDVVGTPSPMSYVPHFLLPFSDHMSFAERVGNTVFTLFERIVFQQFLSAQARLYDEVFAADARRPTLDAIRRNVSLVLINSHFTLHYPRPYAPNMIEVGGLHVNRKATRTLPDDIRKFVEEAPHGCIYFSLGSNVRSSQLPAEMRDGLLRTFAGRKERVLWKWDDNELPGRPANVLISNWFPQDDVLAHPNVRLFITHGGLLSTTEAVYHGLPIVGVPVFGDQFMNMKLAVNSGYAVQVTFSNLTEQSLMWALNEVLGDERYRRNAAMISRRYRDQPMEPLQTAMFWCEYVVRHGGAPHMHSAGQDLSVFAYHGLDVFAFLAFAVVLVVYSMQWALRWLGAVVCGWWAVAGAARRSKKVKAN